MTPREQSSCALTLAKAVKERTEIALNVRFDDGITNRASNVVKKVLLCKPPHPHGIIWVQLDHQSFGIKTRRENVHLYTPDINREWTSIKPITAQFNVGRNKTVSVVRKQFPLRPAAGKTIHRSQGDTEAQIFVDFETSRAILHIHYVGLSRVTSIEGLNIRNLNEKKYIC